MKKKAYETIEKFIKEKDYTYTVEDILENYKKYYVHGYYVSFTTNICIKNLENEIKVLIGGG